MKGAQLAVLLSERPLSGGLDGDERGMLRNAMLSENHMRAMDSLEAYTGPSSKSPELAKDFLSENHMRAMDSLDAYSRPSSKSPKPAKKKKPNSSDMYSRPSSKSPKPAKTIMPDSLDAYSRPSSSSPKPAKKTKPNLNISVSSEPDGIEADKESQEAFMKRSGENSAKGTSDSPASDETLTFKMTRSREQSGKGPAVSVTSPASASSPSSLGRTGSGFIDNRDFSMDRSIRLRRPEFSPVLSIHCDSDDSEQAEPAEQKPVGRDQPRAEGPTTIRKMVLHSLSTLRDSIATEDEMKRDRKFRNFGKTEKNRERPSSAPIPRGSWFFRSSIPAQIVFATRPPSTASQRPTSPQSIGATGETAQSQILNALPVGMKMAFRKATFYKSENKLPDTTRFLKVVIQDEELSTDVFLEHAKIKNENEAGETADAYIMAFPDFLESLDDVKVLARSHVMEQLALDLIGIKADQLQHLFLSEDEALEVFSLEATAKIPGRQSEATGPIVRLSSGIQSFGSLNARKEVLGLTVQGFRGALARMVGMLSMRRREVKRKLPGGPSTAAAKNRRLPLEDLLELRGRQSGTASPVESMLSVNRRMPRSPGKRSPKMSPGLTPQARGAAPMGVNVSGLSGAERQRVILKAMRGGGFGLGGHRMLALQSARQCVREIEKAMAHQTKTRAELEKTLFLRDNAMASVGLYDPQRDALVELGEKDEVLAPRERLLTPVWAWTFPTGANKPPVPVADGWYLISDDPGPVLRISGPFGSRAQCVASIIEPQGKMFVRALGVTRFQAACLEDGKLVDHMIINSFGQKLDEPREKVPDGWYVMMLQAEQARWKATIDMIAVDRDLIYKRAKLRRCRQGVTRNGRQVLAAAEKELAEGVEEVRVKEEQERMLLTKSAQDRAANVFLRRRSVSTNSSTTDANQSEAGQKKEEGAKEGGANKLSCVQRQLKMMMQKRMKRETEAMQEAKKVSEMRVRNLLRPAVAAALMEDQAAEEAVKKVLVSKRELEKTIADADYKLQAGRSELVMVEGPLSAEVIAQHYISSKLNPRVRQALRVVKVEHEVSTVSNWNPDAL